MEVCTFPKLFFVSIIWTASNKANMVLSFIPTMKSINMVLQNVGQVTYWKCLDYRMKVDALSLTVQTPIACVST